MSSALDPAQRVSIRTVRPMIQPDWASSCRNAPTHVWKTASSAGARQKHADLSHPLALLRARDERPCRTSGNSV
jgi:hypothetical protein